MKLKQVYSWMAAAALVLTTASCTSNDSFSEGLTTDFDQTEVFGNGSKIITLTLNTASELGTRADSKIPYVSDGNKVNMLYFEIYEGDTEDAVKLIPSGANSYTKGKKSVTKFPVTLKLAVDPDKHYKIGLWAQHTAENSTAPFTVTDLKNVTVNYADAKCNDDFRDAFCANVSVAGNAQETSVVLHRPFAQINVGTTHADYKNYKEGNILPNKTVTYSKIVVSGVYNTIDVLNDIISYTSPASESPAAEGTTTTATFEYALISGLYAQENSEEYLKVKLNPTDWTKIAWGDGADESVTAENDFFGKKETYPTLKQKKEDDNITVAGASGSIKIENDTKLYLTETFKYLGMCYVLVPSPRAAASGANADNGTHTNEYDPYTSSTVSSVEVYFAETNTDGNNYTNGQKYLTLRTVPVHRNWRTNILGGLADTKESKDPENNPNDPDDPSSLFYNLKVTVNLCPIYFGEYYGVNDKGSIKSETWEQQTFGPDGSNDDLHEENNSK